MQKLSEIEQRVFDLNAKCLTQREIAQEIGGLSPRKVRYIIEHLRSLGFGIRVNRQNAANIDAAEKMLRQGKTNKEIATALGVSSGKVAKWKYNIRTRYSPVQTQGTASCDLSDLERSVLEMNARGLSQKEITKNIGYVSERPLRRMLYDLATRGHAVSFRNVYRCDKHNRVADLKLDGKTSKEIADELGLAVSTVMGLITKARVAGLLPMVGQREDYILKDQSKSLRQLGTRELNYGGRRYDDPAPRNATNASR